MPLTRYWARMARLNALEPYHTAQIRVALIRQAEAAAVTLEQFPAVPDQLGIELIALRVTSQWLITPLENLYEACGTAEANDTYEYLTRSQKAQAPPVVKTGWGARLRSFITTQGAAAVQGITETTRKVVRTALNESAEAGEGIAAAAARLRAKVAGLAAKRARVITRTELMSAANYGSTLGAESTGLRLDKAWLSTPGSRTRPSHAAANGQRVPLQGGVFTVGGEAARYPGDPLLSARERANCRCSIIYKQIGD